jgi:hypothetical protein
VRDRAPRFAPPCLVGSYKKQPARRLDHRVRFATIVVLIFVLVAPISRRSRVPAINTQKLVVATEWMAAACFGGEVKEVPRDEPANSAVTRDRGSVPAVSAGDEHVTVYLSDSAGVNNLVKAQAQGLATQMFAGVGVKIHWHLSSPGASKQGAIGIEFVTHTPTSLLPGALAHARPYEGVYIRIFWDRIQRAPLPNKVLAHVIVHEITHILEGIDRHPVKGVMKAHWSEADFGARGAKPLPFAAEDVSLIHLGLMSRNSRMKAMATHPETTPVAILDARK